MTENQKKVVVAGIAGLALVVIFSAASGGNQVDESCVELENVALEITQRNSAVLEETMAEYDSDDPLSYYDSLLTYAFVASSAIDTFDAVRPHIVDCEMDAYLDEAEDLFDDLDEANEILEASPFADGTAPEPPRIPG